MLRLAVGLLSAVAFAGLSANADAADMIVKAPITKAPPKPEPSGNLGIYLGVFGAYDWGRATFSRSSFARTSGVTWARCCSMTWREFGQVVFGCG